MATLPFFSCSDFKVILFADFLAALKDTEKSIQYPKLLWYESSNHAIFRRKIRLVRRKTKYKGDKPE